MNFQTGVLRGYLGLFILLWLITGNVPAAADAPKTYLLDVDVDVLSREVRVSARRSKSKVGKTKRDKRGKTQTGKTLLVSIPKAAPGFDTPALLYICKNSKYPGCDGSEYELKSYSESRWVDTPARMLLPLLVLRLEATEQFGAVLSAATSPVACELRLDTEIVRLQQVFNTEPSQVHLVLRVQLLDMVARQVVATKVFNIVKSAPSENAQGGVRATNEAVIQLLDDLAKFVKQLNKK
jgi:cholesterol transport system auxiliary component